MDPTLWRRIAAGCRAVGAGSVLYESEGAAGARLSIGSGHEIVRLPCVLSTPDRQGVVRLPGPGYALLGGTARFMAAAVGEGVDEARARFARYARALAHRNPVLVTVAAAHPPARLAWSRPADTEPGSAAAHQLFLLGEFASERLDASAFAHGWWAGRRAAQTKGERLRGPLAELFDQVSATLEEYGTDPALREPGDLSDAQLRHAIRNMMNETV
ncbi:hypothetical protein [Streptomyces sp. NPDC002057]|uniref:hypothetical protein n=1 Tax=Streptomyces sp. NPDC002057 TaxID=3154664 RepID=UPI00332B65A1